MVFTAFLLGAQLKKSANLRKHVRRIRSLNLTMLKNVRMYLLIFFSWFKFLQFAGKIFNKLFNAWGTVIGNLRLK